MPTRTELKKSLLARAVRKGRGAEMRQTIVACLRRANDASLSAAVAQHAQASLEEHFNDEARAFAQSRGVGISFSMWGFDDKDRVIN